MSDEAPAFSHSSKFIASAGLLHTRVPDNTRIFSGYLFGAENYKTITWDELLKVAEKGRIAHPFLNDVETLASTQRISSPTIRKRCRVVSFSMARRCRSSVAFLRCATSCISSHFRWGVCAYAKSGNVDISGFHARTVAGGMFFDDRWVYFAFILNWYAPEGDDPQTVRKFFAAIHEALRRVREALS